MSDLLRSQTNAPELHLIEQNVKINNHQYCSFWKNTVEKRGVTLLCSLTFLVSDDRLQDNLWDFLMSVEHSKVIMCQEEMWMLTKICEYETFEKPVLDWWAVWFQTESFGMNKHFPSVNVRACVSMVCFGLFVAFVYFSDD